MLARSLAHSRYKAFASSSFVTSLPPRTRRPLFRRPSFKEVSDEQYTKMKFAIVASALAALSSVAAQRPTNTSICDYYTTGLLMSNTAENQYMLLKLLVNTVVIGNYTPNAMVTVPGILKNGTVNGTAVNLLPFFAGTSGPTTNRGGRAVSGINFLDGGGATPLLNNTLPTEGSNEYTLLTHLYQYFGYLLGCTMQGQTAFPTYGGNPSQYQVHKYMYLTYAQNTYFINQVALAAQSFGVAPADITVVGTALNSLFNVRCGPSTAVPMTAEAAPQSICVSSDCPLAVNASCAQYAQNVTAGQGPNSSVVGAGNAGNGTRTTGTSASGSGSASGSSSSSTARAEGNTLVAGSFVVGAAAVVAALF